MEHGILWGGKTEKTELTGPTLADIGMAITSLLEGGHVNQVNLDRDDGQSLVAATSRNICTIFYTADELVYFTEGKIGDLSDVALQIFQWFASNDDRWLTAVEWKKEESL